MATTDHSSIRTLTVRIGRLTAATILAATAIAWFTYTLTASVTALTTAMLFSVVSLLVLGAAVIAHVWQKRLKT